MDKKFIMNIQGNEFVLFEGLLNEFHQNGGKEIMTEETSGSTYECPKFKAVVKGTKGLFTGHGDADNSNVNSMISKHKYRMAETRAIARALRWYNNIGLCSADELGGDDKKVIQKPVNQVDSKCAKCGAVMRISKAGKPYCSALCWKNPKQEEPILTAEDLPFEE